MPIEMPKGLPFSVDTWTPKSMRKRYHFLTHAHGDHLAGAASNAAYPIYSTRLTRILVLRHFPQLDESLFVDIEVGESVVINDPDGAFSVAAFDANHCPGAVMFLFEGEFGNVLHTGDCRLTPDCLQHLPLKYLSNKGMGAGLDYLFLDCTFGRCSLKIPSKQSAIQQVISCIWKHPSAPVVYLACDLLGQEEIVIEVCRTFGSKIYIDKNISPECYQSLLLAAPDILSQDPSSHFQVVEGFPRLGERAQENLAVARANLQPAPLFIRPSTQWYACNDHLEMTQKKKPSLVEAERDEFGVWHVCYSMHSSREELEWALQLLQPKWVISTTPPCRAMELEYVKNHCFKTSITPDDPLWKLFKGPIRKVISLPTPIASKVSKMDDITILSGNTSSYVECNRSQQRSLSGTHSVLKLESPSLSSSQSLTLFGRARLGIEDPDVQQQKSVYAIIKNETEALPIKEISLEQTSIVQEGSGAIAVQEYLQKDMVAEQALSSLWGRTAHVEQKEEAEVKTNGSCIISSPGMISSERSVQKLEVADLKREVSCVGSSRTLNTSLKKLYRSMNVPVPRPIPSLVELMSSSKRINIGSESSSSRLGYSSIQP